MLLFFVMNVVGVARADQTKTDVVERLQSATPALQKLTEAGDKGIPDEVLKGAKCVGVVPSMIKGAFIVGGRHGRGVATCRLPDGHWSAPSFFTISGGSFGLQAGVEDVQLVLMIMNDQGMRHLRSDKFQIGAGAEGAAGPMGRHAEAGTDWKISTEILSYSRAKGLFAGINLEGSWIESDQDSTVALYGKDYTHTELLTGTVRPSPQNLRSDVRLRRFFVAPGDFSRPAVGLRLTVRAMAASCQNGLLTGTGSEAIIITANTVNQIF